MEDIFDRVDDDPGELGEFGDDSLLSLSNAGEDGSDVESFDTGN